MFKQFWLENKQNPVSAIVSLAVGFVYLNFAVYTQLNFPYFSGYACSNVGLSTANLIYFAVSALIIAIIVDLQLILAFRKLKLKKVELGLLGAGPILAVLSIICGACSLPILGLVAINGFLTKLGQFSTEIKILSMLLILFGLYLSVRQFRDRCVLGICSIDTK